VNKPTKILVHGLLDSMNNKQWWIDMKNAILDVDDVNIVMVDWSKANGLPYTKATANTQVVGAEIALLMKYMIEKRGAKAADFHIIGHSLGSHVAGYAGRNLPGTGRISGLDPAGPYFENTDPSVRLDPTDAVFVDVIHTDGSHNLLLGLGGLQRMGHVDFYPNGGYNQPKCPATSGKIINAIIQIGTLNIEGFMLTTLCSHMAAVYFYTDSVRKQCPYVGYTCTNFDDFDAGKCSLQCDGNTHQCNRMGYWASSNSGKGALYLKTQDANAYPYCVNHYQVTLLSSSESAQTRGVVTLTLVGTRQTVSVNFDNGDTTFTRNSVETRFIPLTVDIGEVQKIEVDFKKKANLLTTAIYSSTWKFVKAMVLDGDNQNSRSFCADSTGTIDSKTRFASC
jgi:hypothetical protein